MAKSTITSKSPTTAKTIGDQLPPIRDLLIDDWSKVYGVGKETAEQIVNSSNLLQNPEELAKMGNRGIRLCAFYDGEKIVAAGLVGPRLYGDEKPYALDGGVLQKIHYEMIRARHKLCEGVLGRPPRPRETMLMAWGVVDGYGATALTALMKLVEQEYPSTNCLVIDLIEGDERLSKTIQEITSPELNVNDPDHKLPVGVITLPGGTALSAKRVRLPYDMLRRETS